MPEVDNCLSVISRGGYQELPNKMTSSIPSLVKTWKIRHYSVMLGISWVVYFPVKGLYLCNKTPYAHNHTFWQNTYLSFTSLFKNACGKNPPCLNNAICQSGFTDKGYRCFCYPGFKGEHCDEGTRNMFFFLFFSFLSFFSFRKSALKGCSFYRTCITWPDFML